VTGCCHPPPVPRFIHFEDGGDVAIRSASGRTQLAPIRRRLIESRDQSINKRKVNTRRRVVRPVASINADEAMNHSKRIRTATNQLPVHRSRDQRSLQPNTPQIFDFQFDSNVTALPFKQIVQSRK
jgi:hypothetical protein